MKKRAEIYIEPELCNFLHDMTAKSLFKTLVQKKKVIMGRDEQIQEIFYTLGKKNKSNIILTGEPGVGKTAIVEEIARRISCSECPKEFLNYSVCSIDVNGLVSGTSFRGDMEKRIQMLIQFLEKEEKLICFIDEIHQIMNAGVQQAGSGSPIVDALKPFLSRGSSKVIGATTSIEYSRIKKDASLDRRFGVINIEEPDECDIREICSRKIDELSKYHGVEYSEDDIRSAIKGCSKITNRVFPDKLLDLLDSCMSESKALNLKTLSAEVINHRLSKLIDPKSQEDKAATTATNYSNMS